jgi:peptide-methionine (S)-S-oxide reductase
MKTLVQSMLAALTLSVAGCHSQPDSPERMPMKSPSPTNSALELATLGGGCFWCTEAVFQMLPGVKSVASGYAGGHVENPTYEAVCGGRTGHAEVIQVAFDPEQVSYEKVLDVFWQAHDPTTLNRQGNDSGPQYRSIILYHSPAQQATAEKSRAAAQAEFDQPIVTEIVPLEKFYPAEDYHQNYYRQNPNQGYCRAVIRPKVEKFEQKFKKPARMNRAGNFAARVVYLPMILARSA